MNASLPVPRRFSLSCFVRAHPLGCFFAAAFLIAWLPWLIEPVLRDSNPLTAGMLVQWGAFGPALAAMWVSARAGEQEQPPAHPRLLGGGLALGLALIINMPLFEVAASRGFQPLPWAFAVVNTFLPAWVCWRVFNGLPGSRARLRSWLAWCGAALLLMPALSAGGAVLTAWFSGQPAWAWLAALPGHPLLGRLPLAFLSTALYGGPLGEEPGWRGFALPRLQARFSPLVASLILGLVWGFWHFPLHATGFYDAALGGVWAGLLMRALTSLPVSIAFSWLYNRSGGSLAALVLLHTLVNLTPSLVPPGPGFYLLLVLALAAMILVDRMGRKRPPEGL